MAAFAFTSFPTLSTDRLVLRGLTPDDAADVFAFRSDPIVQRYNSEPMKDVAEARPFLAELEQLYAEGKSIHWGTIVKPNPRVVGLMSLNDVSRYHRRAEIGYDLLHSLWGQGIGREAARAVMGFGFGTLALHRIEAQTIRDNHESVRMLEALEFKCEAVLREYSFEDDGLFHDSTIWSLLDREFALHGDR